MWFKNLQVFKLGKEFQIDPEQLNQQLAKLAFADCAASEMQSQGWIAPRNNSDALAHCVNNQYLLCLATEKKLLPSSVINQATKMKAQQLEEQQGFPPGRKAMKELKERVTEELLPRAFAVRRVTQVWIDPVHHLVVVDAANPNRADEVLKLLLKCVDRLPIENLRTKTSPQAAMTDWLAGDEAPKGFTIDQDTELRSTSEEKATVRYVRHSIEPDDVKKHIANGKQCTKLALTWDDKISFVLTDNLTIKRIKPLDILDEGREKGLAEDERLDADFALMTAELAVLIDDVTFALGGEMVAPA